MEDLGGELENTTSVALSKMNAAFENMKVAIGELFAPGTATGAKFLSSAFTNIADQAKIISEELEKASKAEGTFLERFTGKKFGAGTAFGEGGFLEKFVGSPQVKQDAVLVHPVSFYRAFPEFHHLSYYQLQ